jgi:hypothetical protein
MDRYECIKALTDAGMTWCEATWLFHDCLAWRPMSQRWIHVQSLIQSRKETIA